MVQIIQFPTDETIPKEEFKPKDKYGLLIIGKNFYTGFVLGAQSLPRWSPLISGNINIYDWELLMTGTLDFGEVCPLNSLESIVHYEEDENRIIKMSRTIPGEIVRKNFKRELEFYQEKKRKSNNRAYKEVVKIWPGTSEVLPEFKAAIARFTALSKEDSLTSIIIFSHGTNDTMDIGNSFLGYKEFLKNLDRIKGKKSVFVYACNSGSFLKILKAHPQRRNYAAITSCESNSLSTNWNDKRLDDDLFKHFSQGKRYSELELKPVQMSEHVSYPQTLGYFDVRLI